MDNGSNIKKLRQELSEVLGEPVSQGELGNMVGGVSFQTIYNYENNRTTPPSYFIPYLEMMVKMAKNEKTVFCKKTAA